jgi:hypothetical protein
MSVVTHTALVSGRHVQVQASTSVCAKADIPYTQSTLDVQPITRACTLVHQQHLECTLNELNRCTAEQQPTERLSNRAGRCSP